MSTIKPIIKQTDWAFSEPGPIRLAEDGKIGVEAITQLNSLIAAIAKRLNQGLSLGSGDQATQTGNIFGQWIEVTSTPSVADTEFQLPHGLGRTPVGYFVAKRDKAGTLYVSSAGSWNRDVVYFKDSGAAVLLLIMIF
jgi:hypothetical protein